LRPRNSSMPSSLQRLALEKEAELKRLSILQRIWRGLLDAPLWREDVVSRNGGRVSFRIRRKVDKTAVIVFRAGEETYPLRLSIRGLEAIEKTWLRPGPQLKHRSDEVLGLQLKFWQCHAQSNVQGSRKGGNADGHFQRYDTIFFGRDG